MSNPDQPIRTPMPSFTVFTESIKIRPPVVMLRPARHWNFRAMQRISLPNDVAKLSFPEQVPQDRELSGWFT